MGARRPVDWLRTVGAIALAGGVVAAQEAPAEVPADAIRTVMDLVFVVEDIDIKVSEIEAEVRFRLTADILFNFDEATIKPIAFETLQRVAEEIRMRPGVVARVEGHSDGKESDAYNQELSERRAESVRSWLVTEGQLQDVAFETRGFGATQPIAPETRDGGADDPVGRQQNRRVEIVLPAG